MISLTGFRSGAHVALDWVAFAAETLAIAFALFVALTLALLGFDGRLAAHEWALFLGHYVSAGELQRIPVDRFMVTAGLLLLSFVGACRWRSARLVWLENGEGGHDRP